VAFVPSDLAGIPESELRNMESFTKFKTACAAADMRLETFFYTKGDQFSSFRIYIRQPFPTPKKQSSPGLMRRAFNRLMKRSPKISQCSNSIPRVTTAPLEPGPGIHR